jgi:hypothetical protein
MSPPPSLCGQVALLFLLLLLLLLPVTRAEEELLVRVHYPHSALCHSCGLALGSSLNWTALDGSATDYGPTPEGRMDRPAPNLWVKRLYYEAMEWKGRAIELTVLRYATSIG